MAKVKKKIVKEKNKGGRPSKFSQIDMRQLEIVTKKGFTDDEISELFGITKQTLNNYKKENPKFFDSLKDWKLEADNEVEKSLYERAKGYKHEAVHFTAHNGVVTATDYEKIYPPDPTSMIFWLKNRKPKEWRDRYETDNNLSEDEIQKLKSIAGREMEDAL